MLKFILGFVFGSFAGMVITSLAAAASAEDRRMGIKDSESSKDTPVSE